MKNRKQLIADFYLDLLSQDIPFQRHHSKLYVAVRDALADELECSTVMVESIFIRMAAEDKR